MREMNQLVIARDNYLSDDEFKKTIQDVVMLLLNADYIMTVRYDVRDKELGIVCIEYNPADESWGCDYPYWLSPNEIDLVENMSESDGDRDS